MADDPQFGLQASLQPPARQDVSGILPPVAPPARPDPLVPGLSVAPPARAAQPAEAPPTWDQVSGDPAFQALPRDHQLKAKEEYFQHFIGPGLQQLPPEHGGVGDDPTKLNKAYADFMGYEPAQVGLGESISRGAQGGLATSLLPLTAAADVQAGTVAPAEKIHLQRKGQLGLLDPTDPRYQVKFKALTDSWAQEDQLRAAGAIKPEADRTLTGAVAQRAEQTELQPGEAYTGPVSELAGGAANMAGRLPVAALEGAVGGPLARGAAAVGGFGAPDLTETRRRMKAAGLSDEDADKAALVAGATSTAMGMIPIGAEGGVAKRVITGAAGMGVLGPLTRELQNLAAPADRPDLQQKLETLKQAAQDMMFGAAMHGVMGGRGHAAEGPPAGTGLPAAPKLDEETEEAPPAAAAPAAAPPAAAPPSAQPPAAAPPPVSSAPKFEPGERFEGAPGTPFAGQAGTLLKPIQNPDGTTIWHVRHADNSLGQVPENQMAGHVEPPPATSFVHDIGTPVTISGEHPAQGVVKDQMVSPDGNPLYAVDVPGVSMPVIAPEGQVHRAPRAALPAPGTVPIPVTPEGQAAPGGERLPPPVQARVEPNLAAHPGFARPAEPEPAVEAPPQAALPAPRRTATPEGQVGTEAEIEAQRIAQAQRQTDLGLSPDVAAAGAAHPAYPSVLDDPLELADATALDRALTPANMDLLSLATHAATIDPAALSNILRDFRNDPEGYRRAALQLIARSGDTLRPEARGTEAPAGPAEPAPAEPADVARGAEAGERPGGAGAAGGADAAQAPAREPGAAGGPAEPVRRPEAAEQAPVAQAAPPARVAPVEGRTQGTEGPSEQKTAPVAPVATAPASQPKGRPPMPAPRAKAKFPQINTDYDVPLGGGRDNPAHPNGKLKAPGERKTYIDRAIPEWKWNAKAKKWVNQWEEIHEHEVKEEERLAELGYGHKGDAHDVAGNPATEANLKKQGLRKPSERKAYAEHLAPDLDAAKAKAEAGGAQLPPDLDRRVYDAQPHRDLLNKNLPETDQHTPQEKIDAQEVRSDQGQAQEGNAVGQSEDQRGADLQRPAQTGPEAGRPQEQVASADDLGRMSDDRLRSYARGWGLKDTGKRDRASLEAEIRERRQPKFQRGEPGADDVAAHQKTIADPAAASDAQLQRAEVYLNSDRAAGSPAELRAQKAAVQAEIAKRNEFQFQRAAGTQGFEGRMPAAALQALVGRVQARLKGAQWPRIRVIDGMHQADPAARREDARQKAAGARGEPRAWYGRGADGKPEVTINAAAVRNSGDLISAVFHEILGHHGLRGAFGDQLHPALDEFAKTNEAMVRARAENYGLDYEDPRQRRQAAEEVLAHLAQTNPQLPAFRRFVAAVKGLVRKVYNGLGALSDDEIVHKFILPAREWASQADRGGAEREESAFQREPTRVDTLSPESGAADELRGRAPGAEGQVPGTADRGAVPGSGGARGAPELLADAYRQKPGVDLAGLPGRVNVPGIGPVEFHAFGPAQDAARAYMEKAGRPYDPPKVYAKVDPARATRIAEAYAAMPHDPGNPEVKAAYAKMIEETAAQYQAALDAGLKVEFIDPAKGDPYEATGPRGAIMDVVQNNHMWVFPTDAGFGTSADFDPANNPLLAPTEFKISGRTALANDLFRVAHDWFGHVKDGVGFRADGEENAWRSHSAMYSPEARRAMTSETRGQNSWLNFGPEGAKNRTAKTADTVFADQKTGLLPDWVVHEGAGDDSDNIVFARGDAPSEDLSANVRQVEGLSKIVKHLTPAERTKLRADTAKKLVATISTLPHPDEIAAVAHAGVAKRGWYEHSARALGTVFGPDAPRFTALLAALSPQTSVENNLNNALRVWRTWTAEGRPTDPAKIGAIMGRSVQGSGTEASVLDAWRNNSVRALTADEPHKITLSGPKVNSFFQNLMGVSHEVTHDAWMANYADVDQKIFAGRLNAGGTDPGKGPGYLAMSAQVRAAAARLSKLTGETWTPAEVQETVWSWAKTLYELRKKPGEERTARQLLNDRAVTNELINSTPDFRTLFHDQVNRDILRKSGYSAQLDALDAARDAGAGAEGPRPEGKAAPFAPEAAQRHLGRAADRLEALYKRRQDAGKESPNTYAPIDFDEGDSAVAFQRAQEDPFYSALMRSTEQMKGAPKSADAAAWKGWLDGAMRRGEFKGEERDWMGVDQFLDEHKGPITREELQDFVRNNQVKIQDVEQGGPKVAPSDDLYLELERHDLTVPQDSQGWEHAAEKLRRQAESITAGAPEDSSRSRRAEQLNRLAEEAQDQAESAAEPGAHTRYGQYQLPGGENYREHLLTLPDHAQTRYREVKRLLASDEPTDEEYRRLVEEEKQLKPELSKDFRSGHWDEPNVLAHVRTNDRTGPNGEKILHVEEVQSDWHQAGRKRGYKAPPMKVGEPDAYQVTQDQHQWHVTDPASGKTVSPGKGTVSDEADARAYAKRYFDSLAKDQGGSEYTKVPDAPFKQSWPMLAMKRMIRKAAEEGYDKITWTPGSAQADRYDLSKSISEVHYSGTNLKAYDHDGRTVINQTGIKPEDLPDYIGKEAAEKLMAQEPQGTPRSLTGQQLKVGGEGMKGFYDKILPAEIGKYIKKWGGKVGEHDIGRDDADGKTWQIRDANGEVADRGYESENYARIGARGFDQQHTSDAPHTVEPEPMLGSKVPGFDITPQMREAAMQGQPMFQRGEAPSEDTLNKVAMQTAYKPYAELDADQKRLVDHLVAEDAERVPRAAAPVGTKPSTSQSQADATRVAAEGPGALVDPGAHLLPPTSFQRAPTPAQPLPASHAGRVNLTRQLAHGIDIDDTEQVRAVGRGSIGHAFAQLQRSKMKTEQALTDWRNAFDKMLATSAGLQRIRDAVHQWETGKPVTDAQLAPFFNAMKKSFDARVAKIIAGGREMGYLDDYFPHLYKDAAKAKTWLAEYMSRRPLEGGKGWTKERFYKTLEDARKPIAQGGGGLEPISENPADLVQAHLGQLDKYIALHQIATDLDARGLAPAAGKWHAYDENGQRMKNPAGVPYTFESADAAKTWLDQYKIDRNTAKQAAQATGQLAQFAQQWPRANTRFDEYSPNRIPPGWKKVDDSAFVNKLVPEVIAKDLSTILGPSLTSNPYFRAFRKIENSLVSAALGLSGYHATMTTGDTVSAHLGDGIQRASIGDNIGAAKSFGAAFLSPVLSPIKGKAYAEQSLGKTPTGLFTGMLGLNAPADANTAAVLRALEQGGQQVRMSPTELNDSLVKLNRLRNQAQYKLIPALAAQAVKDLARGNVRDAATHAAEMAEMPWEAAHAILENITPLIHKHLVPAQKMTAKVLAMKFEMDAIATRYALMDAQGKRAKPGDYAAIENAMDPDALRQLAGKVVRQVDDRLGQTNYRNLYMNRQMRDIMQAGLMAPGWLIGSMRTIGLGAADLRKLAAGGDVLHGKLDKAGTITDAQMNRLTGRVAYLIGLHALVAGISIGAGYALTGQGPGSDLRNYYTIRTGRKNDDGTDERLSFPSYLRDEIEIAHGALQSPLQAAKNVGQMAANKLNPVFRLMSELGANRDYFGNKVYDPDADSTTQTKQIGEFIAKTAVPFSVTGALKSAQAGAGAGTIAANAFGLNPAPGYMTRTPFFDFLAEHRDDHGHEALLPDEAAHKQVFYKALSDLRSGREPDVSQLNDKEQEKLERYAQTSAPEAALRRLSLQQKLMAWDRASDQEREQYDMQAIIAGHDLSTALSKLSDAEQEKVMAKIDEIADWQPPSEKPPAAPAVQQTAARTQ